MAVTFSATQSKFPVSGVYYTASWRYLLFSSTEAKLERCNLKSHASDTKILSCM